MSEMVERVARALCKSKRNRPEGYPEGWIERHVNENWRLFEDDARTSIEAMREPTDAMVGAGSDIEDIECNDIGLNAARDCWKAMINEVLR